MSFRDSITANSLVKLLSGVTRRHFILLGVVEEVRNPGDALCTTQITPEPAKTPISSRAAWKGEADRLYQDITNAADADAALVRMSTLRQDLGTIAPEALGGSIDIAQ